MISTQDPWQVLGEVGAPDGCTAVEAAVHTTIAIVAYPCMSNYAEFRPLLQVPGVRVVWACSPTEMEGADWVILPGSESTVTDLAWMRRQGIDAAITAHAQAGRQVVGIVGGLQMLGEALIDVQAVEGNVPGLGLLPIVTLLEPPQTVRRMPVKVPALRGAWASLRGVEVQIDAVYQGQTRMRSDMQAAGSAQATEWLQGMVWQSGCGLVLGTYWHGLLANAVALEALWGAQTRLLE